MSTNFEGAGEFSMSRASDFSARSLPEATRQVEAHLQAYLHILDNRPAGERSITTPALMAHISAAHHGLQRILAAMAAQQVPASSCDLDPVRAQIRDRLDLAREAVAEAAREVGAVYDMQRILAGLEREAEQ